jgi:hypothetical protein
MYIYICKCLNIDTNIYVLCLYIRKYMHKYLLNDAVCIRSITTPWEIKYLSRNMQNLFFLSCLWWIPSTSILITKSFLFDWEYRSSGNPNPSWTGPPNPGWEEFPSVIGILNTISLSNTLHRNSFDVIDILVFSNAFFAIVFTRNSASDRYSPALKKESPYVYWKCI